MWTVDNLQDYLIREVALTGEKGISFLDIGPIITNFIFSQTSSDVNNLPLTTESVHGISSYNIPKCFRNVANPISFNSDRSFHRKVWGWLQSHPDVRIKINKLSETEDPSSRQQGTKNEEKSSQQNKCSESRATEKHERERLPTRSEDLVDQDQRIYGSEARTWQALAGHGVDHQKIHALELRLLSIIGTEKEQGIVQPELIKISGQDKRSVPKRTDKLQNHGYIVKRPVIWNGMRTSHCTLKEFAELPDVGTKVGSDFEAVDSLDINKFLRELFTILQEAKIAPLSELRLAMGSLGHRRETKFLALAIRRLEILGCLKRVLAKVTDRPTEVTKWMQCIKYIKWPTDREQNILTSMTHDQELLIRASEQQDDQDVMSATDLRWVKHLTSGANDELSLQGQWIQKIDSLWTPYLSYLNLIYDCVEDSGAKGISSMDLRDNTFGSFCKKPFDVIISRLTDNGRTSQPVSLQHLTLVKDASFQDRVSHYTYRTFYNFQLAIESGEAAKEVLHELNTDLPYRAMASPSAIDKGQWKAPDERDGTLSDLYRILSVSTSVRLSKKLLRNRHEKRQNTSAANELNVTSPSGANQFLAKQSSVNTEKPKKRGRPRKYPVNKELSREMLNTNSDDSGRLDQDNRSLQSKTKVGDTEINNPLSPVKTPLVKSRPNSVTSSNKSSNILDGANKMHRNRKRSLLSQEATHAKYSKTVHLPENNRNYELGPVLNGSSSANNEPYISDQATHSVDLRKYALIECSSNITNRHSDQLSPGVCFSKSRNKRLVEWHGADNSLIIIIRSKKLRQLDWFVRDKRILFQSQIETQEDKGYMAVENDTVGKNRIRKSSRLVSPKTPETSDKYKKLTIHDQPGGVNSTSNIVGKHDSRRNEKSFEKAVRSSRSLFSNAEEDTVSRVPNIRDVRPILLEQSNSKSSLNESVLSIEGYNVRVSGSAETHFISQNIKKQLSKIQPESQLQISESSLVSKSGLVSSDQLSPRGEIKEKPKKQKLHIGSGSIVHQRTQIILSILQKCEGVFPGGSEICAPFSSLWKRLHGTTTDSRTIMRAVKDAIDCGKIRRVHFSFKSRDGTINTRNVLTLVAIAPDSSSVRTLQRGMIDSFPRSYRPPQIEDDLSPKPSIPLRHVFQKDTSCPAERQYRPLYLRKLEEHRATMADKRFTRSIENRSMNRRKVQRERGRNEHISGNQMSHWQSTAGGVKRLSRLFPLVTTAFSRQTSYDNMIMGLFSVRRNERSNTARKDESQRDTKAFASDMFKMYQRMRPAMKIENATDPMIKGLSTLGLQYYIDQTTTLVEPTQFFQPSTGTFTTEFSIFRLKKSLTRQKLAESLQPIFEEIMPQSVNEMQQLHDNHHDQQVNSYNDQGYTRFNHELQEVSLWERKNEILFSSDLRLQETRFINHTAPIKNFLQQNDLDTRSPSMISPLSWLPSDTTYNELNRRAKAQLIPPKGHEYSSRLSEGRKNAIYIRNPAVDKLFGKLSAVSGCRDATYWPQTVIKQLNPSSILSGVPPRSNSDMLQELTQLPPGDNQVSSQVTHQDLYASSTFGPKILNENFRQVANNDGSDREILAHSLKKRRRNRMRKTIFRTDAAFSKRLILAVNIVRILSGGVERLINWQFVVRSSREFSQVQPLSLQKHWLFLKKKRYLNVELEEARIQEALLAAYKRGFALSIDFQNLHNCDWRSTVDKVHELLVHEQELAQENTHNEATGIHFTSTSTDQAHESQSMRNELNSQNTLQMRRDHLLTILPSWEILVSKNLDLYNTNISSTTSEQSKARSWVRANILTISENYIPAIALRKLQQLGEDVVGSALNYFEERNHVREVSVRTNNLRNLEMSETFHSNFKNPISVSVLQDAMAYKASIDEWITSNHSELSSNGEPATGLRIDPASPSGAFLAVTNLAAADRIVVVPRSLPLGIGFDSPSPTTLEYDLEIRPSSRYIQGNPLRRKIFNWPPVPSVFTDGDAEGKIPLWIDIHGNIIQQWWDRIRACILGLIATRTGISIDGLTWAMNESVERWEADAVVQWLMNVEAVKWLDMASDGRGSIQTKPRYGRGLKTMEWWWMAVA